MNKTVQKQWFMPWFSLCVYNSTKQIFSLHFLSRFLRNFGSPIIDMGSKIPFLFWKFQGPNLTHGLKIFLLRSLCIILTECEWREFLACVPCIPRRPNLYAIQNSWCQPFLASSYNVFMQNCRPTKHDILNEAAYLEGFLREYVLCSSVT